jgi:hypothetical protein
LKYMLYLQETTLLFIEVYARRIRSRKDLI